MIEFNALYPVFVAADLAALSRFYRDRFGFEAVFFDPSFYLHLKHPGNAAELGFVAPNHPSQPASLQAVAPRDGHVVTLEVDNADAALQQLGAAGEELAMPLTEEAWGQRHFMLRDPAGLLLDIVEAGA